MKNIFVVENMTFTRANIMLVLEKNDFAIAGSATHAERAWQEIQFLNVDLVLIDIHLSGEKNGIWLADQIQNNLDIPFIYLTAFDDDKTINEILKTNPQGYIVKPFKNSELIASIKLALNRSANGAQKVNTNNKTEDKHLIVKKGKVLQKIYLKNITHLKSDGNYVHIFEENMKHLVRSSLAKLQEQLSRTEFIRVHQRYLVAIKKVNAVDHKTIFIGDSSIPISKPYVIKVLNLFQKN